ncbi:gamma-carboxygeranoyl-CoA hydratase [Arenicella chitinivorans]|uniref:Gamma-carboxygeranoyl-CoA hydratase n=1 Tax=Arenicella chitinivorans TaxID=1329800 RepID=A0A918VH91_9GAMM|nr:enoyl-CoA hydratase/isomerase family protein [Arenicella chitinivorans]GGZ97547.1 gamma-carboxygeranoyl-CoA hydratase [Arenicella chitinivorans]
MSDHIRLDIDTQGVATVTLTRAEKHNAFDDTVIADLTAVFTQLDRNDDVRVVVLAAEGKSFSAGADLGWMQRMASYTEAENHADAMALATMLHCLYSLSKPTIAAVQGAAFGGAVGLVSCCDMAVASDRASFCLSEVKLGLIPATISPYVIHAIGTRIARRYFLTAERFDAHQAKHMNLVHEVVSPNELDSTVTTLTKSLLSNSPAALTACKTLIDTVAAQPISAQLREDTSRRIAAIRVSEQGQEGLTAFLQKRAPNWVEQ